MQQRELFEKAYIDFADSIFRYIYFRTFDREIAKELTQETFFRVWDYAIKGKKIENMRAFLYRTAHNIVVNYIRDKKNSLSIEELQEKIDFDIIDSNQQESRQKEIDMNSIVDSFKILNEEEIELIKIRYFDGLSIEEISKIKEKTVNNISVKIHRIIEKLKKYNTQ